MGAILFKKQIMSKRIFTMLLSAVALLTITLSSCTGGGSGSGGSGYVGKYEDEFGNKFELRADYTATIQFAGQETANETHWSDGPDHNSPFATIEYNGNPNYYFMRDGVLYRHHEDMERGTARITIKRE